MRPDIEDEICLSVPTDPDSTELRWWSIRQPPPSVAFALQAQMLSALGAKVGEAVMALLRLSPASMGSDELNDEGESLVVQDIRADTETLGEAHALKVFRNARQGKNLVQPGESLEVAGDRLRSCLYLISRHVGVEMSSAKLVGDPSRVKDNLAFTWASPALIHRLLLSSELRFGGTAKKPQYPSGLEDKPTPQTMLSKAVNEGSVNG